MTKYLLATFLLFGLLSFVSLTYVTIAQIVSQSTAQVNGDGTSDAGTICVSNSTLDALGQQACRRAGQDARTKCDETCKKQCGLETPSAKCDTTIFHLKDTTAGQCSQTSASQFINWISGGRLGVPKFTKPCTVHGTCQYFCKASPATQASQSATQELKTTRDQKVGGQKVSGQKVSAQEPEIIYRDKAEVPSDGTIDRVKVTFKEKINDWLARTYYVYLTLTQDFRSVTTWRFSPSGNGTDEYTGVFYLSENQQIGWSSGKVNVSVYAVPTNNPAVTAYGDCVADRGTDTNVSNHYCNQKRSNGEPAAFYPAISCRNSATGGGLILWKSPQVISKANAQDVYWPPDNPTTQAVEDYLRNLCRNNGFDTRPFIPDDPNDPNDVNYDCDDFSRDLEKDVEESGYRGTITVISKGGVGHEITDAHYITPDGPGTLWIEPQDCSVRRHPTEGTRWTGGTWKGFNSGPDANAEYGPPDS